MTDKENLYQKKMTPEEIRSHILAIDRVRTCEFVIKEKNSNKGEDLFNFIVRDNDDKRYGAAFPLTSGWQVVQDMKCCLNT